MEHTYHYTLNKGRWAIAIFLSARIEESTSQDVQIIETGPGIHLDLTECSDLFDEEIAFLKLGVLLIANGMTQDDLAKQIKLPVRIKLLDIKFDEVHYQSEGLACAMAGWLADEIHVPVPQIPATFDHIQNRYIFDFPQL